MVALDGHTPCAVEFCDESGVGTSGCPHSQGATTNWPTPACPLSPVCCWWLLPRFCSDRLKILDTFDDEAKETWSTIDKLDELEAWHIWFAALPAIIIVSTPVATLRAVLLVAYR